MNNIRLILTDLDETLLHSDKSVSDKSAEVFRKCREAGILFGFSTLRGYDSVASYIAQLKPDVLILNGGAVIRYEGQLIHCETFTVAQTRMLLAAAYRVIGADCEMTLDTVDKLYWNRADDKSAVYPVECTFDDMRDFREPACKMCIRTTDSDALDKITESAGAISTIPFSDIPWYKLSPLNATKENAVKILSDYLHIPSESIAAFGDDFSDIKMLASVGYGVAPENAIAAVKKSVKYLTLSNNEDGVAVWIENNILNKNINKS